ncbi:MAG: hypothetical protein ABIB93_00805 [Chloroflexota bacterium]
MINLRNEEIYRTVIVRSDRHEAIANINSVIARSDSGEAIRPPRPDFTDCFA